MGDSGVANPFSVTKAVFFTDTQIKDLWVDPPGYGKTSSDAVFDPRDPMPLLLLGAKGSGRTHLLRYHSYDLRRKDSHHDPRSTVIGDGYVAVYFKCDILHSGRFNDYIEDDVQKDLAFAYFFDLTLAILLVDLESNLVEDGVVSDATRPTLGEVFDSFEGSLRGALTKERRELDLKINSLPFQDAPLSLAPRASRGELIRGQACHIRQWLKADLNADINVVVFLDEFENFSERQQRYINTLMRDETSFSFKIGARTYGVKSFDILGDEVGETNKVGAEFSRIHLDEKLKESPDYHRFVQDLIKRRLGREEVMGDWLSQRLTELDDSDFSFMAGKDKRKHLEVFEKWLAYQDQREVDAARILATLDALETPLLQMAWCLHLYKNLRAAPLDVAEARKAAQKQLGHHKQSLLCQLYRIYTRKVRPLIGLSTIIELSAGAVRNALVILRDMYIASDFEGIAAFSDNEQIPIHVQDQAVLHASESFFKDCLSSCTDAGRIEGGMRNLASFFRKVRHSYKPSVSNPCSFSLKPDTQLALDVQDGALETILRQCVNSSLLLPIRTSGLDKNSSITQEVYQLHPMTSRYFDISHTRRGRIELNTGQFLSCFGYPDEGEWRAFLDERLSEMDVLRSYDASNQRTLNFDTD